MRETLKQSLLADGFGVSIDEGTDPHCLLIPFDQFEEYWEWARKNNVICRPVPMGEVDVSTNFEDNDIHNSKVVFVPDTVKYLFAKLKWS